MGKEIRDIVKESVTELSGINEITDDTVLFGGSGLFDSMELVTLITDLEERVRNEVSPDITLADENAFSESDSPFKTVQSATVFIQGKTGK